jgi:hypothetical protein
MSHDFSQLAVENVSIVLLTRPLSSWSPPYARGGTMVREGSNHGARGGGTGAWPTQAQKMLGLSFKSYFTCKQKSVFQINFIWRKHWPKTFVSHFKSLYKVRKSKCFGFEF